MTKRKAVITGGELPYQPDDDQLTTALTKEWDGKVKYFYGQFHVYESGFWTPRDREEVTRYVRRFLTKHREILGEGKVSQARVSSITNMLKDEVYTPDRDIKAMQEDNAHYINLRNGLFNLKTFQLEPHRKEYLDTTQLDFNYNPDAECPTFHRYLKTSLVDKAGEPDFDMIALVQEAIAYSMTARTDLKASFWLVGKPESGKSTLLGFVRALMGNLHTTIDLNQLATNRFLLSGIVGKRVVTFSESDSSLFIPDALYKAMVGGQDEIYVDVKNKTGIAFVPTCKFIWAMNNPPRFNDRSGATVNRLRVILFDRSIPPDQKIGDLADMLKAERSGVFNWLMIGYKRLLERGVFTSPARSEFWRDNYRLQNDTEQNWFNDRLERGAEHRIQAEALYMDYTMWCKNNGFHPKSQTQLAPELDRLGLKKADNKINGRWFWFGARFQPTDLSPLVGN